MTGNFRVKINLLLCAACLTGCSVVAAEDWPSLEYQLKAVYLYKFLNFVEWPPESFPDKDAPVIIGILGSDPFGPAFDQALKDKTANGRKVVIKRYVQPEEAHGCHILFIAISETPRLPQILKTLENQNTLTVGELPDFAHEGGTARFFLEDNKIRFEINLKAAKQARLKINSQLLSLAKTF